MGFVVLPYIQPDPVLCKRLEEAGAATVMPLAAPIGTNKGIVVREMLSIIIEQSRVPVGVSAGRRRRPRAHGRRLCACRRGRTRSLRGRSRRSAHLGRGQQSADIVPRLNRRRYVFRRTVAIQLGGDHRAHHGQACGRRRDRTGQATAHDRRLHGARIARGCALPRSYGAPQPPLYAGALRQDHIDVHTDVHNQLVLKFVRLLRLQPPQQIRPSRRSSSAAPYAASRRSTICCWSRARIPAPPASTTSNARWASAAPTSTISR